MGRTCAVLGCHSQGPTSLFRVPIGNDRNPSWLKFLRIVNSNWMWEPAECMFVCELHFESKYILKGGNGKKRLLDTGYPSIYNGVQLEAMRNDDNAYEGTSTEIQLENVCDAEDKDDTISRLQEKLTHSNQQLQECRAKLKVANQKIRRQEEKRKREEEEERNGKKCKLDDDALIHTLEEKIESPALLEIVKRVVVGKPKAPYSDLLKEFCYRLHYYAGKGYEVLRCQFDKYLPATYSFSRWTQHVKSEPGFLPDAFAYLSHVNSTTEGRNYYALCFDEVHIRKQIIHKDNGFVGYIDYGGIIPVEEDCQKKIASAALFVLAVAINGKHKLPICYVLTNGLKATVLQVIIRECLIKMKESGSTVLSLTFDGMPSNFSSMQQLGANLNPLSSNYKPFIQDPTFEVDINIIPDVCHMMKLFRNLFKKYGSMKNYRGESISWVFIHRLQKLQDAEGLKAANKLTNRHINFELNKMKTKLCLQVMSNSVATALKVCRILCIPGFEHSAATEEFLFFINSLFDILNSKYGGFGDKAPLRPSKMAEILPFFAMMRFYLLTLTVNEKGCKVLLIDSKRNAAVKGLVTAMNSVEKIMKDIVGHSDHYLEYLPTFKLSQDNIELFFGTLRARFGHNNNPNVVQLANAVKGILCMKAKCIVEGNCAIQEDDEGTRVCAFRNINTILDEGDDCLFSEPTIEELPDLSDFVGNVVDYIAGCVGFKMSRRLRCTDCILNLCPDENDMIKLHDECILIREKDKGGLFYPSYLLLSICKLTEQLYRKQKEAGVHNLSKDLVVKQLVNECTKRNYLESWRKSEDKECEHRSEWIRSVTFEFLKIRMHHDGKQETLKINPSTTRNFNNRLYLLRGQQVMVCKIVYDFLMFKLCILTL